jgi:hypothetical protein
MGVCCAMFLFMDKCSRVVHSGYHYMFLMGFFSDFEWNITW